MMVENPIIYEFDGIRVDPHEYRILKADCALQVEPKAFQVLVFLLENRGRLVEKRELLDRVWKETFVTENALTREIAQLRKALGENAREAKYIQTVPTKGYRFIADVQICSARASIEQITPTVLKGEHAAVEPAVLPIQVTEAIEHDSQVGQHIQRPAKFIYLGAILVLILAGGVFIWHTYLRSDFKTRIVRGNKQVTAWIGLDINPALSPDGSSVAYSSNHNGNFEIFIKPLASGGREIQITSDSGQNFEPAWSPDGRYIAYHSRDRGGIWVTPALGGPSHQLTRFGSSPAWSPDGANIVFQEQAYTDISSVALGAIPPSSIWTVPAAGGEARPITRSGSPSGGHSAPSWSPDGKRILFMANDTSFREIWSVSAAGGDLKRLTTNNEPYFDPIYAPDGESIYCGGISKNSTYGLWRIRITPGSGERVGEAVEVQSTGTQPLRNLSISANGKRIVYSMRSLTSDIWSVPLSETSGTETAAPVPLNQDKSFRKTNPAISPDGKKIAFDVWRVGVPGSIWLMDADGRNLEQLSTGPTNNSFPSWIASDKIAYVDFKEGRGGMWLTSLKTRGQQELLSLSPGTSFPRMSPDGKQVAYNFRQGTTINVWKVAIEDRKLRQLTFDKELIGFPTWSPDGNYLAVEIKRGDDTHIGVMSSEGGAITQLTFDRGQSWPYGWSPDGQKIAYAGFRNGVWNVYWVSVKDRTQKQLTNFNKLNAYVRYPSWSPLGDQIVFEYAEMTGNIWEMELE